MAARALRTGRVRDIMQVQMVTVVPEMTVRELALTLLESGVRSAPVLDRAGKVLGVVTQADVTSWALGMGSLRSSGRAGDKCAGPVPAEGGERAGDDPEQIRVRNVMRPVGDTVRSDEPLSTLVRRFLLGRVSHLLVMENGMLLGIVTPVDVLGAIDATL